MELKNYFAKNGEVPAGTLAVYKGLGDAPIISEFSQAIARRRADLKLPEVSVNDDTQKEIAKLTELTGWRNILKSAEAQVASKKKAEDK